MRVGLQWPGRLIHRRKNKYSTFEVWDLMPNISFYEKGNTFLGRHGVIKSQVYSAMN